MDGTVTAATETLVETNALVAGYCRGSGVTVTLDDGPTIESTTWVCD
ncbi:hypothetical protein [Halorientalis pallida]|nr:hypothetical protein [Halorientalis pallida]